MKECDGAVLPFIGALHIRKVEGISYYVVDSLLLLWKEHKK